MSNAIQTYNSTTCYERYPEGAITLEPLSLTSTAFTTIPLFFSAQRTFFGSKMGLAAGLLYNTFMTSFCHFFAIRFKELAEEQARGKDVHWSEGFSLNKIAFSSESGALVTDLALGTAVHVARTISNQGRNTYKDILPLEKRLEGVKVSDLMLNEDYNKLSTDAKEAKSAFNSIQSSFRNERSASEAFVHFFNGILKQIGFRADDAQGDQNPPYDSSFTSLQLAQDFSSPDNQRSLGDHYRRAQRATSSIQQVIYANPADHPKLSQLARLTIARQYIREYLEQNPFDNGKITAEANKNCFGPIITDRFAAIDRFVATLEPQLPDEEDRNLFKDGLKRMFFDFHKIPATQQGSNNEILLAQTKSLESSAVLKKFLITNPKLASSVSNSDSATKINQQLKDWNQLKKLQAKKGLPSYAPDAVIGKTPESWYQRIWGQRNWLDRTFKGVEVGALILQISAVVKKQISFSDELREICLDQVRANNISTL